MDFKRFVLSVAIALSADVALFAAYEDYADYVSLTKVNNSGSTSWNSANGWSDGQAPHSGTNYYVGVGKLLWRSSDKQDDDVLSTWAGGQLVVAGTLHIAASVSDSKAPQISDLVLLGGSDVRTATYGPFYPRNNVTSEVTVAGTISNPAQISHHYSQSCTSGGYVRNHTLHAYFKGTSESALVYTRPFVNHSGIVCDYGFYAIAPNYIFSEYPGSVIIRGGNTVFKPLATEAFNWPFTALKVEEGAHCHFYQNDTFTVNTENAYLRALDFSGGVIVLNMRQENAAFKSYPVINVTEALRVDGVGTIKVKGLTSATIKGITPENPEGRIMKVAHLSGGAADVPADLSGVKVESLLGSECARFMSLAYADNEDGTKDVYLSAPGIVTMTNVNVESTGHPAGAVQYGAFQQGHSGDWSNLKTPPSDSKLHYWAQKRLCFFEDTQLPDATLTLDANSSWKGGPNIAFKEINIFSGVSLGLWGGNSQRKITADRLNILCKEAAPASPATIYVGHGFTLTIDAEITGNGPLCLKNMNNQRCTFVLPHLNTNFHGRLLFTQWSNLETQTVHQTCCKISDARNLGGEYTASSDCFNAIEFSKHPCMLVVNDVAFTDPTRGMYLKDGVRFDVASGKTLSLANQITYEGVFEKTGDGMLELAGSCRFIDGRQDTAPVASSNELHVLAGSLKISSKTAADGLSVIFAEGTKLVIPADAEGGYYNVKWSNPLVVNTEDGTLPVEMDFTGEASSDNTEVTICTFAAAAAEKIPLSLFKIAKPSTGCTVKSFVKKILPGGNVAYVVTVGSVGMQVIVR